MPRNARFTLPDRPSVYHVISRTALPGFPLGDIEKDKLLDIIRYFSKIYFVDLLGFAIMGNHWHLAVKVYPKEYADRDEVKERFASRYGEDIYFGDKEHEKFSKKWTDLSEFVRGRIRDRQNLHFFLTAHNQASYLCLSSQLKPLTIGGHHAQKRQIHPPR